MIIQKNLSIAHRIVAELKMDDLTYTHLSSVNHNRETFFLSPFGIQFKDVTPDDLVEFKFNGGFASEPQEYNKTGFAIHSSIYKARKDVNSIIHLHTKEIIAVASSKKGLIPVSQHALHFYEQVSYHSYDSLILEQASEEALFIKDLGKNNIMLLQNHGFITLGKTIWEALFYAYHLQKACEIQVLIKDDFILPKHETCIKARNELLSFEKDLGRRDFESFKHIHLNFK